MSRLIDADALMQTLGITDMDCGRCDLHGTIGCSKKGGFVDACVAIEHAPIIEERKTGKWEIYVISPFDGEGCRCSECGFEGAPYWDFCPNCGSYNGGE